MTTPTIGYTRKPSAESIAAAFLEFGLATYPTPENDFCGFVRSAIMRRARELDALAPAEAAPDAAVPVARWDMRLSDSMIGGMMVCPEESHDGGWVRYVDVAKFLAPPHPATRQPTYEDAVAIARDFREMSPSGDNNHAMLAALKYHGATFPAREGKV